MNGIPISSSPAPSTTSSAHWDPRGLSGMNHQSEVNSAAGLSPYGLDSTYSTPSQHHHYNNASFPYVASPSSSSVGGPSSSAASSSHRPRSGGYTASSNHRSSYSSEVPPPPSLPIQYTNPSGGPTPRQNSLASSSLASHEDYSPSPLTWSHSQPSSLVGSRNNSIYGLDGQLGNLAVGTAQAAAQGAAPTAALETSHAPFSAYEGASPLQNRHVSHTGPTMAHADRRFSLDERRSFNPRNGQSGTNTPGRVWPWGGGGSSQMPSSVAIGTSSGSYGTVPSLSNSAVPIHARASYDYGSMSSRSSLPGTNNGGNSAPAQEGVGGGLGWPGYDSNTLNSGGRNNPLGIEHQNVPARIRAMSSSGPISGRAHPYASAYGSSQLAMSGHAHQFGRPSSPPSADYDISAPSSASKMKIFPASQSPSAAMPSTIPPGIGPGGGVTRRTKFKRSRTGCLVCRKRKVKCSQDGTPCRQCRIGKRDCYYQEEPRKAGKGKRKDDKDRRESLVSLGGTEDGSEDESDDDEDEEGADSSFNGSLLPRGSNPEEQLHNFGGAAPIPRYEALYQVSPVHHQPSGHQQQIAPVYDPAIRGGVEFHMPFEGQSTSQHQLQHSPPQQQHSTHQSQHQHYHHPHQNTTASIDSSVRSVGSAGSIGGESSFDTAGSTGPNSIGSVGGAGGAPHSNHHGIQGSLGPLHKVDDGQGRHAGAAGGVGTGGWYDPVAAVLRGEDAQSRYF